MEDQEQTLQTQLDTADGAVNYLLVLIGGILLSFLAAVRQRDALCQAIQDGTEGPAPGALFPLRAGSSALIVGSLGFFFHQALDALQAAGPDDPDGCRSAQRNALAAFLAQADPTVPELADMKTAVSEAVTNAIIHGYENTLHKVHIRAWIQGKNLFLEVSDKGVGIPDVKKAMEPLFTTKPEMERSGMGFSFMEAFMDSVEVESEPGKGTCVKMTRTVGKGREIWTTQSL